MVNFKLGDKSESPTVSCSFMCHVDNFTFITFITELKIHHHLFHLSFSTTTSTLLFLAQYAGSVSYMNSV